MIPVTLALTIPVVFRRTHPVGAFAAVIAVGAFQVAFLLRPTAPDLAIVVLLYTVAAYTVRRISVTGLAICLLGSAAELAELHPHMVRSGLSNWALMGLILFAGPCLIAWVLGDSMRYRRAYYANLEERAARLERDRDAQAQMAAAAERARIARELHDVVAHNVSVMVVQADGAAYALGTDPGRAREALAAISATGRQALTEMRVLLGVLRKNDESEPAATAAVAGQAGAASLVGAAGHRPARRSARTDQGCRAAGVLHRRGRTATAAGRDRAGRLPDPPGVADEHPQARRPVGARERAAALRPRRGGGGGHRQRAGRRGRQRRRRPRPDRDARARRSVRRVGPGRATAGGRLPGHGAAADRSRTARRRVSGPEAQALRRRAGGTA